MIFSYSLLIDEKFVNMFTILTPLLFLPVIFCSLLLPEYSVSGNTAPGVALTDDKIFANTQIKKYLDPKGTEINGGDDDDNSINTNNYCSPSFVAINNVIVAITGVNCIDGSSGNIQVLTRYFEIKEGSELPKPPSNNDIDNGENGWKTQVAVKENWKEEGKKSKIILSAANDGKIYILLVSNSNEEPSEPPEDELQWNCKLYVGSVNTSEPNGKKIIWDDGETLNDTIEQIKKGFKDKNLNNFPSDGFVIFGKEKEIFFVLQFDNGDTGNKKIKTFAFIKLKDTMTTVTFADVDYKSDCSFNLFTWQNKIMMLNKCTDIESMKVLNNNGDNWENTNDPLFRALHHVKSKNYFIATSIGDNNKDVLLFTQQRNNLLFPNNSKKFCIDLWMTDGNRSYKVGPIINGDNREVVIDGLLYTNDKLFSLHHKKEEEQAINFVIFTNLEQHLKTIKETLNKWKKSDDKIQKLCKSSTVSKVPCVTSGLVSFLSKIENKKWEDDYGYADISFSDCTEFENGIKCDGPGKGVKWLVEKQNAEDQPYNFTDSGFTFVAIVTVGKVKENNYNSILGVGISNQDKSFGLACSGNKKLAVFKEKDLKQLQRTTANCEQDSTYQVMIILEEKNKRFAVYIDGNKLERSTADTIEIANTENISYFYFGADNRETNNNANVTIENVLLYNRPFHSNEIVKLKEIKEEITIDSEKENNGNNISDQQSTGENLVITEETERDGGGKSTSDTLTDGVVPSSTQQRESAVGNNVNIVNVNVVMYVVCCIYYLYCW